MTEMKNGGLSNRVNAGTAKATAVHNRSLFVEAYIQNGGNARQAAISAGYSARSAGSIGHEILKEPEVFAAIARRRAELQMSTAMTTEAILEELRKIAFADIRQVMTTDGKVKPLSEWPDDIAKAVSSVEVGDGGRFKIRLWDKNSALEKAMRSLGMFKEDNAQRADALARLFSEIDGSTRSL